MSTLLVNQEEVCALLPMRECIAVMEQALGDLARGQAAQPLRQALPVPGGNGLMVMMPGYAGSIGTVGAKVFTVFPGNVGTGYDAHQGAVLLFETEHGCLQAIVDGTAITPTTTAALRAGSHRVSVTLHRHSQYASAKKKPEIIVT